MTGAKVILKAFNRELGWWEFMHLPRSGEMLALTVNDVPSSFTVSGVVHVPVMRGNLGAGKHPVPYTVVVVDEPQAVEMP